jgi:hypothetical protein
MSNIVEWLRIVADDYGNGRCEEAADEITRLTAENERLRLALLTIAGHPELYNTKGYDIARAALSPAQAAPKTPAEKAWEQASAELADIEAIAQENDDEFGKLWS